MMKDWEREIYILHSHTEEYQKHKTEAKEIINQALEKYPGKWAIAYSGGKDSTVLLHLLLETGWKGPLFFYYYSEIENPPENIEMAKREASEHNLELYILDCYESSSLAVYRKLGYFFIYPATEEEKKIVRQVDTAFRKKAEDFARQHGIIGIFLGMRKEESRTRTLSLIKTGPLYKAKKRDTYTCCPLQNWTGNDVWAYIVENHLPYLACYDTDGYDRRRLRNEINLLCTKKSMSLGLLEQYKRTYSDILKKLKFEFPDIDRWIGREIR